MFSAYFVLFEVDKNLSYFSFFNIKYTHNINTQKSTND